MSLLVLAAIIVGAASLAVALMLLARRFEPVAAFSTDHARSAAVFEMVGTSFAVLLAFVIFVAFESYSDAKTAAESEAVTVLEMFRVAEFFPSTGRAELQASLGCYARAVVEDEWRTMRDQRLSSVVDHWVEEIELAARDVPVTTGKERAAFAALLQQSDERVATRRERLSQAIPIITAPVWFVLGIGGLVAILFVILFFSNRRESVLPDAGLIAAVTTMVVTGLSLAWFLDHPYEDKAGSVRPVEMRRSIAIMESEHPLLALPCTPDGTPRPA